MKEISALLLLISGVDLTVKPTSSNGNTHVDVENHLLHLEQTVKEMQSKAKTQEQKYAAVLSNVLSKLTATNDELKDVKNELNSVKNKYQSQLDNVTLRLKAQELEYVRLRSDLNISDTYLQSALCNLTDALKSSNENISLDVTQLTTDMKVVSEKMQSILKTPHTLQSKVVFEGWDSEKNLSVQGGKVWKFPNHKGSYYDGKTGYFSVPVTGNYVFWVNGFARIPDSHQDVRVFIKQEETIFGYAHGRAVDTDGYTAVTGMIVSHLQSGSRVWFTPNVNVTFLKYASRFGGFLL